MTWRQRSEPDRHHGRTVDQTPFVSAAFASAIGEPKKPLVSVGAMRHARLAARKIFTPSITIEMLLTSNPSQTRVH